MLEFYLTTCIISFIILIASNFLVIEALKIKKRKLKNGGSKVKGLLLQMIISLIPIIRLMVIISLYTIAFCSDERFKKDFGTIEEDK
jgi:heme/copper-type cytochrome/quinol oxidase subunit 2